MTNQDWPTTTEIGTIFAEVIAEAGGKVLDQFEDGTRLIARSVLPGLREVGRDDLVQGGVAIRATEREIRVHPYVFRQVCQNGAIRAQAIQTLRIAREETTGSFAEVASGELREAIRACCSEEAFASSVDEMRSAREVRVDTILVMLPILARLPRSMANQFMAAIIDRFTEEEDSSRFGLMNAITSVARDTADPDLRWRLEELGGGVPVAVESPGPRLDPSRANLVMA